jgi:hypothetical protein
VARVAFVVVPGELTALDPIVSESSLTNGTGAGAPDPTDPGPRRPASPAWANLGGYFQPVMSRIVARPLMLCWTLT